MKILDLLMTGLWLAIGAFQLKSLVEMVKYIFKTRSLDFVQVFIILAHICILALSVYSIARRW